MAWNIAIVSFLIVFLSSTLLSLLRRFPGNRETNQLDEYLLAGSRLSQPKVISLLLSTSFGINTLFYQGWLGYTIGAWGLVIQGAWAISFFLLAPFSRKIREFRSLHDLLGNSFNIGTKVVASICTLIGILYLMGWELGVGKSAAQSIFLSEGLEVSTSETLAHYLVIFIVFGGLLYTVLGGLRGNATADIVLNALKLICILFVLYNIGKVFFKSDTTSIWTSLFPSFQTLKANMGWLGLISNIAFSLAWQFVDNSTWQSIIAGEEKRGTETKRNLNWSGLAVFIAPGIVGTFLGIFLSVSPSIDQNNIFSSLISLMVGSEAFHLYLIFIIITACSMSMIDGLLLASGYTLVIDILFPKQTLNQLNSNPKTAESVLLVTRILLVLLAVIAIWGINLIFQLLNVSLFDFVYVIVITQLSMFGPIIVGLYGRTPILPGWTCIVISLIVGFASVILAGIFQQPWLIESTSIITIAVSILTAIIFTKKQSSFNR